MSCGCRRVYATLDWAGGRLDGEGQDHSIWADLAGPASIVETNDKRARSRRNRQGKLANLLQEVLDGGPARDHLRTHLRRALGLEDNERGWAELDELLWGFPRPLMLAVLPTALRRLRSGWSGEVPTSEDHSVRTRTPMREFVAGNLFDELMVPEVLVRIPTNADAEEHETKVLPALRTIRELMPGNVTRHFGVSTWSRRHWVPLPIEESGQRTLNLEYSYAARFLTTLPPSPESPSPIDIFRPMEVELSVPPEGVRDASSVLPMWHCHIDSLGSGREVEISARRWQSVLLSMRFHTHAVGDGARVHRFALGAHGTTLTRGDVAPEAVEIAFESSTGNGNRAALGVELEVDAFNLEIHVPSIESNPTPGERSDRLRTLILNDEELPSNLNWFQRLSLTSALLAVLAEESNGRTAGVTLEEIPDALLADSLVTALERMGLIDAGDPLVLEDGQPGDQAGETRQEANRRDQMIVWCHHESVLRSLRAAVIAALDDRDQAWERWRRRRIAATVTALALESACQVCPEISAEDLAIDVGDANDDTGIVEVWVTEQAPGGNGHVEELFRAVAEDPKQFSRVLDRCVEPSEIEALDGEVRTFLENVLQKEELESVCHRLRMAWVVGHSEVSDAFNELRLSAEARGFKAHRSTWTTIVNRLLGPGSLPELLATTRDLLERWDVLNSGLGLEIDLRAFGAVCATDYSLDGVFQIPANADEALRGRSISNFFWPRSGAAMSVGSDRSDPFGVLPELDRVGLREILGNDPETIVVKDWDAGDRDRVHMSLHESGEVRLRFSPQDNRLAREIVLELQSTPIDLGVLLSYPNIVGIEQTHDLGILMTISLAEIV